MPKSSAVLGFGFELLNSGERFKAIMALLLKKKKIILDKITAFSTSSILGLCFNIGQQVCVINSSQSFHAINLKLHIYFISKI